MTARTTAPFRAEHVGSLLRPTALAEARQRWRDGEIDDDVLRAIEDEHIRDAVRMQEEIGIGAVTDGEYRRDYWHLDFLAGFDGIDIADETYGHAFSGGGTVGTAYTARKITSHDGRMRPHMAFLAEAASVPAKLSIPGPGMTHLRGNRNAVSKDVYPDIAEFWNDLRDAYIGEVRALYDAGCRYIQFDDVSFAYLCDEDFREGVRENGDDPDDLAETYARVTGEIARATPYDMATAVHMCRGNNQSTWMTEGGYEAVAERMFAALDVDAYFMEYDSERAGGFEPLRFVPDGKFVVLGLVTSKLPELESVDGLRERIDDAARFMPLENMCLSPQCGFASTHHGNKVTPDDQRRKLGLVVEAANAVWGTA